MEILSKRLFHSIEIALTQDIRSFQKGRNDGNRSLGVKVLCVARMGFVPGPYTTRPYKRIFLQSASDNV
jgi:hypothetical protein